MMHLSSIVLLVWAGLLAVGCTWLNTSLAMFLVFAAVAVGLTAVFER